MANVVLDVMGGGKVAPPTRELRLGGTSSAARLAKGFRARQQQQQQRTRHHDAGTLLTSPAARPPGPMEVLCTVSMYVE